MDSLNTGSQRLIGKTVHHRAFGSGVIEKLSENTVTVNFPQGDKKFIYPDAFENFLKLEDKDSLKAFNSLMEKRRSKIQAKKQEIHEKEETRRKIRSMKIIPSSHAVFSVDEAGLKECEIKGYAFTGRYMSGFSEGLARRAGRVKPNSLCLMTVLEKGQPESERMLRGLFMAGVDFYGEDCGDGQVVAHDKYRIFLDRKQAVRIWDYVAEDEKPKRFGGLKFRYVSEDSAKNILLAVKEKLGEDKKEFTDEFYDYFCRVNRIPVPRK